jgi:leucyl aminopeptidase
LVADVGNCGRIDIGDGCNAAAFLERFVEKDIKWCHLDICSAPKTAYKPKGIDGVRGVIEYL